MTAELPAAVSERLRAEVRQWLASRPDLAIADLAQHTSLAESTVRNYLSGHCNGGREVVGEVRRVLEQARAGDILAPGGAEQNRVLAEQPGRRVRRVAQQRNFYATETARKVTEVLEYCVEHAAIGVITADFGVGKTEAVAAWRRGPGRGIDSLVFEFTEFSSANKVALVYELSRMLAADGVYGSQNGGMLFRAVVEKLRQEPCLLIFDQCETVRARVFQVLRQIWDATHEAGVGMVLLSAPILLQRMMGSRMADLGALTSRVGVWAPLSGVSRGEMAAIVRQEGITDVDQDAFDLWWKATGGSMRRLMRAVDLLRARHQGKRITEKTIAGVASHLWGMAIEGA